jgi:tight adherence protein C
MQFAKYLPPGITPDMLILGLAAIAAAITVLAVWQALLVRDPLGPRLKALAERRAALKAGLTAPPRRQRKERRKATSVGFIRGFVNRFTVLKKRQGKSKVVRLAQAGYRSKDAPIVYVFCKATLPVVFGATAAFLIYVAKVHEMKPLYQALVTGGSIILGFFGPDLWIRNQAQKRQLQLRRGLPDALDLLVICAEAGLGMDAAFSRVSREMIKSSPECADEFGLCSIELSFLPERRQALLNLADRTGMAEFRAIVNTLMQTEKYGTPLANSLRVLSAEFRNDRLMKAEEKAARLPAILTVPMIIFILPCLFVILLGPAIFRIVDALSKMGG